MQNLDGIYTGGAGEHSHQTGEILYAHAYILHQAGSQAPKCAKNENRVIVWVMKQPIDGVGTAPRAARLAPGEIARLREHAEAAGRPVTTRIESRRPAAGGQPTTAGKNPTATDKQSAASSGQATSRETNQKTAFWFDEDDVPQLSQWPNAAVATPTIARHGDRLMTAARHGGRRLWPAAASILAGLLGLALLVGGAIAGQSALSSRQSSGATSGGPILAGETAAPAATGMPRLNTALAEQQELQGILDNLVAKEQVPFYVYIKDLKTGATATRAADRAVTSASLYKLFVADRIYSLIDQQRLGLSQNTKGTDFSIGTCLGRMIKVSDNDCGRYLGEMIGWGNQDTWMRSRGYVSTTLNRPQQTSATDTGLLLERLYRGQLNSPASNRQLLSFMKAQIFADRLRAGLPAGTVVADKTGNLDGYVHDAGIVYGPKTDYVIVVMTGEWSSPSTAPTEIAQLSRRIWDYLEN